MSRLLCLWLLWATMPHLAAAPAPPERRCALRLAWWANPPERVELAILQGKAIVPFVPLEMNLDLARPYQGPAQLRILRKKGTGEKAARFDPETLQARLGSVEAPPAGRRENLDDWELFAEVALPASADVGVLLLLTPDGTVAGRAFDLEDTRFPYGTIRMVNLTPATLVGELDARGFKVPPGGSAPLPGVFRERRACPMKLAAALPDESPAPILETKLAGRPNRRSLVFVLQTGISADGRPRFESRSIESVQPVSPGEGGVVDR